ncbi:MAG: TrkA family potassium uptake protein [Eubacteriales bacterium]|nr:TrkA family potassium uptake protein [Eubacteriales bacterium]MDD4540823.1 TrkA family potassium uptake protein [Eubacteriales bacterium]
MKIIIVGGGKLARYLTETLVKFDNDYEIILIEQVEEIGAEIANRFESVKVLHGDGTDIKVLADAEADGADYYIALTGKDEDNLVGCHIAKTVFHVRNTVAHVNNPSNIELFELLNVDHVHSRAVILADIIEQDIAQEGMRVIYNIPNQRTNILEIELSPSSAAVGKTLAEYKFPEKTLVALIIHTDGSSEVPRGSSLMRKGDRLLLVSSSEYYEDIYDALVAQG